MALETSVPLFRGHPGLLFHFRGHRRGRPRLFKEQDEFIVQLQQAVPGKGKRPHDGGAAAGVAGGDLLPDDRPHIVEADGLAKFDDLRAYRHDFIATVVGGPGKLVTDVKAQAAAGMQHPPALLPDQIQMIDVVFVGIMVADL